MEVLLSVIALCATALWLFRNGLSFRPTFVLPEIRFVIAREPSTPFDPETRPAPPSDILEVAARESEPFAQEAVLKRSFQLFDQLGDWGKVKRELVRVYDSSTVAVEE